MFTFSHKAKVFSIALIIIGVIGVAASFLTGGGHAEADHAATAQVDHGHDHAAAADHGDHHTATAAHDDHKAANRPWAALYLNTFFFLGIGLGATFFLAVQYAAQAAWAVVVKRVMEAVSGFIIVPGIVILVILLASGLHMNHLFHWMEAGITDPNAPNFDEIIAGKAAYLNFPFFMIRAILYIAVWVWAAKTLRKFSIKEDQYGGLDYYKKSFRVAVGFIIFFAVSSSTSAWDFIMSIDPHWFSTLFGWYTFAGYFVTSISVITLVAMYLKSKGLMAEFNENHLQDLAKFMFAFSVFWTYLWFSQFMLIWYANIPEEVTYYMARFGQYKIPFFTMLVLNFVLPLLVLMSRDFKRNMYFVSTGAVFIITGHWLDHFVMIMPGTVGGHWGIGLPEISGFLMYAGLFIWVVFTALERVPLVVKHHPLLQESKNHHI